MVLRKLKLHNFRNHQNLKVDLNPFLSVFFGKNSIGKTNLLEAIYFLSEGEGFREKKEEELIFFTKNHASVEGEFYEGDYKFHFRIDLTKKHDQLKKDYFINQAKVSLNHYLREAKRVVFFAPWHLEIVEKSPSLRRDYFDNILKRSSFSYRIAWHNYHEALKKRNKILESESSFAKIKEELSFWNEYLEKQSVIIQEKRKDYVDFLNENGKIDNRLFFVNYQLSRFDKENVRKVFDDELRQKTTLIGPQRDDFVFYLLANGKKKNLHRFGSRSEIRLSLFWLKLNELIFWEKKQKSKPLLLLDDIFSEFDRQNQKLILSSTLNYQTILTTTDELVLRLIETPKSVIFLH